MNGSNTQTAQAAFVNQRDEVVHQIGAHSQELYERAEHLAKELSALDTRRDDLVQTIAILRNAASGMKQALAVENNTKEILERAVAERAYNKPGRDW
ncbi:MAG: hypothetical protein BGO39_04975 [Chloroflexi bacterium 54-19]|nr:MAG: hypothetical protein BGO39_04975 [Chloroflexi bacterium 54-19]